MKRNEIIRTSLIMLVSVVVFGLCAFGLNFHTEPKIEEYKYETEYKPLFEVAPEGSTIEKVIYESTNAGGSELKNVSSNVTKVYETSFGYIVKVNASSAYSKAPMVLTLGVSKEGIITGLTMNEYHDTADYDIRNKNPEFISSFTGENTTLSGVETVATSTVSSQTVINAINSVLESLVSNNLIKETKKTTEQVFNEVIVANHSGLTHNGTVVKVEDIAVSGNITKAVKADNDSGFAFMMTKNDQTYFAVVNAFGVCKVYDITKTEVTSKHEDLVTEAKAASQGQTSYLSKLERKARTLFGLTKDDTDKYTYTWKSLDVFNSTVAACDFTYNGNTYTVLYSRVLAYMGHPMDIYMAIDSNGKIAKVSVDTMILESDYYHDYEIPEGYLDFYIGLDNTTLNGEELLIAGATITTGAIKTAIQEAYVALYGNVTPSTVQQGSLTDVVFAVIALGAMAVVFLSTKKGGKK